MDASPQKFRIPALAVRAALPAVIVLGAVSFIGAVIAWVLAAGEMIPTSAIAVWAMRGLAAASGFAVPMGGTVLSLPPTLLNLVVFFAVYWSARRMKALMDEDDATAPRQIGAAAAVAGVFAVLVIAAAVIGGAEADLRGAVRVVVLLAVPVLVALRPAEARIHQMVRDYMGSAALEALIVSRRMTLRVFIGLIIGSHIVFAILVGFRFGSIMNLLSAFSSPAAAAVGLGLVQLIYAPTLWAAGIAWVSGAGVTLAKGVDVSVFAGAEGLVPPIPLLYAFPAEPSPWAPFLMLIPVICAVWAVIGRSRWQAAAQLWPAVFSSVQILIGFAILSLFFSGGIGRGGLQEVGVDVVPMMVFAGLGTCASVFIGVSMVWMRDRYAEQSEQEA